MSTPISIVFFGTPIFAATCLEALLNNSDYQVKLVVTQPDRPAGRGKKLTASPVKECALKSKIPVLQPTSVRKELETFLPQLNEYGPFDVGVVVAFGQILPQALLSLPRVGCINVHGSILPRWRGAAPIQRAIMSGDTETGIGLMQMEAGLDTGPVFTEARTTIEPHDTFGSLHDKLAYSGATLLRNNLKAIVHGTLSSSPQTAEGVTYAEKIRNEEALINWQKSAEEANRLIRGLSPVPGAFTYCNGLRLKIFDALSGQESLHPAGTMYLSGDLLCIACGQGHVQLKTVQLEGRKRCSAQEFIRGLTATLPLQLQNKP